jgi:hypothetical protein
MGLKIINNQKVDMTDDEWNLYQKIVKSYTTTSNRGEDLFQDLFVSDDKGIIKFIKPPSVRQTSFEIFLFLISIFQHQHLRLMYAQVADITQQMKDKMKEMDAKSLELDEKIKKLST